MMNCLCEQPGGAALTQRAREIAMKYGGEEMPGGSWTCRTEGLLFREFWIPYVLAAEEELSSVFAGYAAGCLQEALLWLTGQLCGLAKLPLQLLFQMDILENGSILNALRLEEQPQDTGSGYDGFVRRHLKCGYQMLWKEFPVLENLIARFSCEFVDFMEELGARLAADAGLIRNSFEGLNIENLQSLELGLSDLHSGKRSVIRLGFGEERFLYYKPRPLEMQKGLELFLQYFNGIGLPLPVLTAPYVLVRPDYGWMGEYCAFQRHQAEESAAFYQRAGMLLGMIDLLSGIDFHRENIVVCGDQPVIVDAETLLHPVVSWEQFPDVLSRSGMISGNEQGRNCSGIPPCSGEDVHWLVKGFESIHLWHMQHHEIWEKGKPLWQFFYGRAGRLLARDTREYNRMFCHILLPDSLLDEAHFRKALDLLYPKNRKAEKAGLYEAEKEAVNNLDVPVFYTNTAQKQVRDSTGTVVLELSESPYHSARKRACSIRKNELEERLTVLRKILQE